MKFNQAVSETKCGTTHPSHYTMCSKQLASNIDLIRF